MTLPWSRYPDGRAVAGWCALARGRPLAWPLVSCRSGAAEAPGSRPAAGRRRRRCGAALSPEGRPRTLRGTRSGDERRPAGPAPLSGRGGQELIQCLRGGLPAEGPAGPAVQLGGYLVQAFLAVSSQVRALGEVLAQQPVMPR